MKTIKNILLIAILLSALPAILLSQNAIFNLTGEIGKDDNNNNILLFQWQSAVPSLMGENSDFTIMIKNGESVVEEKKQFVKYVQIPDTEIHAEGNEFYYEHRYQLPNDTYSFYISAVKDGIVYISNVIDVLVDEQNNSSLVFTDKSESMNIVVGDELKYQFSAEDINNPTSPIKYTILNPEINATINPNTGAFRWIPEQNGIFYIGIKAYSENNIANHILKYLEVKVANCETFGSLEIIVVNENGEDVNSGRIDMVPVINDDGTYVGSHQRKFVKNGKVKFNVDAGKYQILYQGELDYKLWYPVAIERGGAATMNIKCGENRHIAFNVNPYNYKLYNVSGKVTNVKNEVVPEAFITFEGIKNGVIQQSFLAHVDEEGKYSIELPDIYTYRANATLFGSFEDSGGLMNFLPLYYNQTYEMEKAEIITLNEDIKNIDFKFGKIPDFEYKTISGIVTYDNVPYKNAIVTAEAFNNDMDILFNHLYFHYETDEQGRFEADLPVGFKYSLKAHVNSHGFNETKFYKDTYLYDEAEEILLTEDIDNVIFNFKNISSELNSVITGKLNLPEDFEYGIRFGYVDAILMNSNSESSEIFRGKTVLSDTQGNFEITGLLEGEYVLFAYSANPDLLPGYYTEGGQTSMEFEKAALVKVPKNGKISHITINFSSLYSEVNEDGKIKASGVIKQKGVDKNVAGAQVFLINENGDPISFGRSRADGEFMLENINIGEFQLIVSKPGYSDFVSTVVIDGSKFNIGDIELIPSKTTNVNEDGYVFKVYPNPVSDFLRIETVNNLPQTVKIFDSQGKLMLSATENIIETSFLSAGIYFVKISTPEKIELIPIIISR